MRVVRAVGMLCGTLMLLCLSGISVSTASGAACPSGTVTVHVVDVQGAALPLPLPPVPFVAGGSALKPAVDVFPTAPLPISGCEVCAPSPNSCESLYPCYLTCPLDAGGNAVLSALPDTYIGGFGGTNFGGGPVYAQKPEFQYVPSYYHDKLERAHADPITVTAGMDTPITIVAHQAGAITGRITDPRGRPLAGICVGAPVESPGARATWITTDAAGTYRVQLEAHNYNGGQEGGDSAPAASVQVVFFRVELSGRLGVNSCASGYDAKHVVRKQQAVVSLTVPLDITVTANAVLPVVCKVPRIIGKKLKAAKTALVAAGCSVGKVTRRMIARRRGKVIAQGARPGKMLPINTAIRVVVGR
jgi:hypothetical protein